MLTAPDEKTLADILPGTWAVAASSFPMWLRGEKLNPTFTYTMLGTAPLVLDDDVAYSTPDGKLKHVLGTDTWRRDGFQWRGKGLLRPLSSRWSVSGVTKDGTIAAIRFSKSLVTSAGIDIIVREGATPPEPRAMVAIASERFGLSAEDFATLTWLDPRATS